MPTYNCGKFIAESIDSVCAQSYKNWELIVIDDCSTDNTEDIVKGYGDSRIKYFKNETNSGAAVSRNKALCEARGEWIAFLDSDDLWAPQKLERQLEFMKSNGYKFSCTGRENISEDGAPLGIFERSPKKIGMLKMFCYCWPAALTVMYHVPTVGLIQIADLKKNNDYAMWLKVVKECDCYYLDENLAEYRIRKGSIAHSSLLRYIKSFYTMYRKSEQFGCVSSFMLAGINCFFAVLKKTFYAKKINSKKEIFKL